MKTRIPLLLAVAMLLPGTATVAGTMYKSIGPDGSVIYSDAPPANAAPVKTLTFTPLPATPMPDSVLRYRESLKGASNRAPATSSAPATVAANSAQIFTAPWCHVCRKAKAYLAEKKIAYKEFNVETPEGQAALTAVGDSEGVPVIAWRGQRLEGFTPEAHDKLFARAK